MDLICSCVNWCKSTLNITESIRAFLSVEIKGFGSQQEQGLVGIEEYWNGKLHDENNREPGYQF